MQHTDQNLALGMAMEIPQRPLVGSEELQCTARAAISGNAHTL